MKTRLFALAVALAPLLTAPRAGPAARIGVASPVAQKPTLEEITRAVPGPGVYFDAGSGSLRLSTVTGSLPRGLDFQTKSTPQPVWMKIEGPRAAVRTGSQPTFYFYHVEVARTGRPGAYRFAATLHAAQAQGEQRLLKWPGTFSVRSRDRIAQPNPNEAIECAVEELAEGLYRLGPAAPLQSGEYAFLPWRALAEVSLTLAMGTPYSPKTAVYAFGVDSQ